MQDNGKFRRLVESSRKQLSGEGDNSKTEGLTEEEKNLLYEGMMVLNEKAIPQEDITPEDDDDDKPEDQPWDDEPEPFSREWFKKHGYIEVLPGVWCQPGGPCYICTEDGNCVHCNEPCPGRPDDMPGPYEPIRPQRRKPINDPTYIPPTTGLGHEKAGNGGAGGP